MENRKLMELSNEMSILGFSLRKESLTKEEKVEKEAELAVLSKEYNAELKKLIRAKSKMQISTRTKKPG